ncbi:MAG TPA: hypothetical protein ENI73_03140 [Spirochaetes bacterium]|nr:hypothetical protein [Spirochaetota bacterium]
MTHYNPSYEKPMEASSDPYIHEIIDLKNNPPDPLHQKEWNQQYIQLNRYRFLKKSHYDQVSHSLQAFQRFFLLTLVACLFFSSLNYSHSIT